MSQLRLIKEHTTSVAATDFTFTDLFVEGYDCFMVTMTGKAASSAAGGHLSVGDESGSIQRLSHYAWGLRYMKGNAGDGDLQSDNSTDWANCGGVYDTTGGETVWYIFNPYDADTNTYFVGFNATTTSGDSRAYRYGGCYKKDIRVTGLSFDMDNTMTYTIRSYGLRVDE